MSDVIPAFDWADPDAARRAFLDLASAYERAVKADARTRRRKSEAVSDE